MKLDESFDITHLFHDPNVNPTMVRVISSDPCLRLLCVYPLFCSIVEVQYSSHIFTTRVIRSFYHFASPICCGKKRNLSMTHQWTCKATGLLLRKSMGTFIYRNYLMKNQPLQSK